MMIWLGDKVPGTFAVEIWRSGLALFSERGRCCYVWVHPRRGLLALQFSGARRGGYTGSGPYGASAAEARPGASAGHPEHMLRVVPVRVREAA